MIALHAKHYYAGDAYPMLIAAGGVASRRGTQSPRSGCKAARRRGGRGRALLPAVLAAGALGAGDGRATRRSSAACCT